MATVYSDQPQPTKEQTDVNQRQQRQQRSATAYYRLAAKASRAGDHRAEARYLGKANALRARAYAQPAQPTKEQPTMDSNDPTGHVAMEAKLGPDTYAPQPYTPLQTLDHALHDLFNELNLDGSASGVLDAARQVLDAWWPYRAQVIPTSHRPTKS